MTSLISLPAGHAAFPGANGKIVFTSYRDGNPEIYVMDADGSNQTRLTYNPGENGEDNVPAWSPDGSKIVFHSGRDGNYEIYVMNADGTGQTNLTNNPATDHAASWSPDGTRIVFTSDRDGNNEIYVMDADGSNQTRLTYNGASDYRPRWSPDGLKIAFQSFRDGNSEIYIMNADGTGQTNLTNNPAEDDAPDWQPLQLVITVAIDIKPGSDPNSINPRSRGRIPVAVLTTDTFDATTVDSTTVLFGPTGTEAAPVHSALEDVDADGDTDMILHFNTQDTGIACGNTSAWLTGETVGGLAIEGSDSIRTVGCK